MVESFDSLSMLPKTFNKSIVSKHNASEGTLAACCIDKERGFLNNMNVWGNEVALSTIYE